MDVKSEIGAHVANLTPELQEQVLRFVASLAPTALKGESGTSLRRFAGSIDRASAREMIEAIEQECERVDAEW